MRKATFPIGGLFPPGRKNLTESGRIRNAIMPPTTIVPLHQTGERPAIATVSVGDRVGEGDRVGRGSASRSAHIHSPVPGVVSGLVDVSFGPAGSSPALQIQMDGEFQRLGKPADRYDWSSFEAKTILRLIREAGVVDMTGSAGPVDRTLTLDNGQRCEYLVVSGAESEPYVTVTCRMLVEYAAELVEAIAIVRRVLQPTHTIVAVESDKAEGLARFRLAAEAAGQKMQFVSLEPKYPQSDERQLVRAATGKEVPSGREARAIGCVTLSAATLYAIWEAVVTRKPLIERIVTVSGDALEQPANLKVRIGTPIGSLLKECGLVPERAARIVVGGPLRGVSVEDLAIPVIKNTNAVLALTSSEVKAAPQTPCIQCGRCTQACPMGLNPERLFKLTDHGQLARAEEEGLFDCTECGACSHICPARIPLLEGLVHGKAARRSS